MQAPRPLNKLAMILAAAGLAACTTTATNQKVTIQEDFASTDIHAHSFPGTDKATCEAARRALLSQGYVIHEANPSLVRGRKNFQPGADVHMQIEFHIVCAPDSKGSNSTTAFVTAVRDRYSLKKSSTSASLGVPALGSLSVPFGMSDESLVRVASETIANKLFYERFFALVERYFDDSSVPEPETTANQLGDQ
ncbi:DUF2242 domain-containing protein [Noviherbaspirillum denitrificans]|uniref:DUF2242 domain-containing protein n=1 Tax=Noviherbaspirillum denitrificans TaxID=1968433 RepID=A0A254THN5_9BURK|nr:DUF2242 domain-containing protein [Noviherbaspirillum denitrificans]OWW22114.1 hypothetical protein AYR66_24075 [Noviherbaspirillum denitrificans]